MEDLTEFLPFLLFLLYAILRVLRGRKRTSEQPTPLPDVDVEASSAAQPRTDFDQLARHLESLISGSPVDAKSPPPRPEPRYEPEFHNSEVDVDESASFQHEIHGFGAENPFSEESFERRKAFAPTPRVSASGFDPHDLKRSSGVPEKPVSPWTKRLADPKRAREAFVFQTILERPRDRKR